MKEQDVQRIILRYLHALGIFSWKQANTGVYDPVRKIFRTNTSLKGVSDILGVLPFDGRILAIEVKSDKGKASPEQKLFLEMIKKNGGVSGIARSVEDVDKILKEACVKIEG